MWSLCCQCHCCENVHNKIYPEQLDYTEWALAKSGSTDNNKNQADDVDGQLVLDELASVVENVASPLRSVFN